MNNLRFLIACLCWTTIAVGQDAPPNTDPPSDAELATALADDQRNTPEFFDAMQEACARKLHSALAGGLGNADVETRIAVLRNVLTMESVECAKVFKLALENADLWVVPANDPEAAKRLLVFHKMFTFKSTRSIGKKPPRDSEMGFLSDAQDRAPMIADLAAFIEAEE